jgi:hypothetical protein
VTTTSNSDGVYAYIRKQVHHRKSDRSVERQSSQTARKRRRDMERSIKIQMKAFERMRLRVVLQRRRCQRAMDPELVLPMPNDTSLLHCPPIRSRCLSPIRSSPAPNPHRTEYHAQRWEQRQGETHFSLHTAVGCFSRRHRRFCRLLKSKGLRRFVQWISDISSSGLIRFRLLQKAVLRWRYSGNQVAHNFTVVVSRLAVTRRRLPPVYISIQERVRRSEG